MAHFHGKKYKAQFSIRSASLEKDKLLSVAQMVSKIAEETRVRTMEEIQLFCKDELDQAQKEDDRETIESLKLHTSVTEHALLPGYSVVADGGEVEIFTHEPDRIFDESNNIERITMEFGVGRLDPEGKIGHVIRHAWPFASQMEGAGKVTVEVGDDRFSQSVVKVTAVSSDPTWTHGVVNRIKKLLDGCENRNFYLHGIWADTLFPLMAASIFGGGVWLLFTSLVGKEELGLSSWFPLALLFPAMITGFYLGHKILKYMRWIFPRLEFTPVPLDIRNKHRRRLVWFAGTVFVPLLFNILWNLFFGN